MTKLKDKLTANVRKAKASQQPPAKKPATDRLASSRPTAAAPVPTHTPAPAPAPAPSKRAAATPSRPAGIPESGSALFPSRVWPD